MPLHCTAIGKAMLAHSGPKLLRQVTGTRMERRTPRTVTAPGLLRRQLERAVQTGVAFEYEESAVGIACVAAPVLDTENRPVAAISVAGPVTRFHPASHVVSVKAAAAGVAATLARRDSVIAGVEA